MDTFEQRRDGFLISTDKARLDIPLIHHFLSTQAYWSLGRPLASVQTSVEHSLCFGVYEDDQQVGFARVVTDYSTFAWLADVFILPSHRGRGLSKWLVECIVTHPILRDLRRILLATRDAHELYRRYGGFETVQQPERWMVRVTDPNASR